jgi:hypothetical protein
MNDKNICKKCKKEISAKLDVCPNCGAKQNTKSFKNAMIIFGILVVFVIVGLVMSNSGNNATSQNNTQSSQKNIQANKWNTKDVDAMTNGNIPIAAGLLKTPTDTKTNAVDAIPADVIKTPDSYNGEIIKFTGSIALLSDYAAGSEFSKIFGGVQSCEIAIYAKDGTVVDMFVGIPKGDLKLGENITLYGYPVGRTLIQSNNGDKTSRLIVVGNAFDK